MTNHEKEAVLNYLEFALTSMVERLEREGIVIEQSQVGATYDAAYEVLNDMEQTLTAHQEICQQECSKLT